MLNIQNKGGMDQVFKAERSAKNRGESESELIKALEGRFVDVNHCVL